MPGNYRERLKEAEAWIARARTPEERKAFEAIADVWRKLIENQARPAHDNTRD